MTAEWEGAAEAAEADDRLDLRLWVRLYACTSLIEAKVRRHLRDEFASTLPRFDLLSQLERAPEGLTMGELSRRLMVSNGNVTGLIERLVGEGAVERLAAPGDRRIQRVCITAEGRRQFHAMAPVHRRWIEDILAGLPRQDRAALDRLLARLKEAVEAAPE